MRRMTIGRLLVERALPPELRGRDQVLDKGAVARLFQELAERRPELYRETAKRLSDVGRQAAFAAGGFSVGLRHLLPSPETTLRREALRRRVEQIRRDPRLDEDARDAAVVEAVSAQMKPMEEETYRAALQAQNPLALQVRSGTRGNRMNLRSLHVGDMLYSDAHDRPIPIPVLRSYSEGLTPVEYWAGAYGARKGIYEVKKSVADAGYWQKGLRNATHDLVVVPEDEDDDEEGSPRPLVGLPVPTDDMDSAGSLLAAPAGGHPRNTPVTPRLLHELRSRGVEHILVRSPIAGGPRAFGGVYARDVGVREGGGLPPAGDIVGLGAADSIGEKVSQGGLSSKHTGGVAGASNLASGFKFLQALTNVPKAFPSGAAHAQKDGAVQAVRGAPQGGQYVTVNGVDHYVPADQSVTVKVGQDVEAGDVLSDGLPNPAEIVRHKGVGEGRRHYVDAFTRALRASNIPVQRRNVELVARGLINHVRFDDEHGAFDPEQLVPYSLVAAGWTPRDGALELDPGQAVGRYLERPVLHHTIGTRVRPSMLPELRRFGVEKVLAHPEPPPFHAEMLRAPAQMEVHPDWMTRQLGSNVKKTLLDAAATGGVSDPRGTSYVPGAARRVDFGRYGQLRPGGPRDGDRDGYVLDGTPHERPAPGGPR